MSDEMILELEKFIADKMEEINANKKMSKKERIEKVAVLYDVFNYLRDYENNRKAVQEYQLKKAKQEKMRGDR